MFKFLKLQNSNSGDARRHVPFASIIHKRFFIISICLVFVFILTFSEPVYALDFPIPPISVPLFNFNSQSIEPNYELLSDDQKEIANELFGFSAITASPVLGYYRLKQSFNNINDFRAWVSDFGVKFFNDHKLSITGVTSPAISDMFGSSIYKASQYQSYNDFVTDTTSNGINQYFIEYNPLLTLSVKDWLAAHDISLDEWQYSDKPWTTNFAWNSVSLSGIYLENYNAAVNNLSSPKAHANFTYNSDTYVNVTVQLPQKYNIFLNTNNNTCYLVNAYGVNPDILFNIPFVYVHTYSYSSYTDTLDQLGFPTRNFSDFQGNTLVEITKSIYNNFDLILGSKYSYVYFDPTQVVNKVYYGADWDHKQELYNIDDLNITPTNTPYIDNFPDTAYIDVVGTILDSLDTVDIRDAVLQNTLVKDGDIAMEATDVAMVVTDDYVTDPPSGIIVPTNLFSPLADFIGYVWHMTKPLIVFTRDVIDSLVFDPVDGFRGSGPGYFFFGIVGIGLIGGLVVKCLL